MLTARRTLLALTLALLTLGVVAGPALAGGDRPFRDRDRRINLSGGVVVADNERIDGIVLSFDGDVRINGVVDNDVYVGRGDLVVAGRVTDDVVVVKGDAVILGEVGGDVVVIGGRAIVREGAVVSGDVESGDRARIEGTVEGEVNDLDVDTIVGGVVLGLLVFLWVSITIAVAVLGAILLALFPRAADAAVAAGRERVGAAFGWGALLGIVAPAVGAAIASTILGLPLGIFILGVLAVAALFGYLTTCLVVGRLMVKGTTSGARFGAFFAGFGVLRVAAIVPGIGFLVAFVACIYGIGVLAVTAWRAGNRAGPAPASTDADGPVTPPAPPDTTPATPSATGTTTATKTAPAKKTTPAKKPGPAKKATATKATPAKKTAPAKKTTPPKQR